MAYTPNLRVARGRLTCSFLALALAAPATLRADERTITCASSNYRYNYCRVDTDNRASLVSQRSPLAKCELGRSWGYDNRGVWVDRGCSGDFRVGKSGSGAATAAGAAIIGAMIAGAIVASRNNDKQRDELPSWAIGSFRGYDERDRANIDIRISPSGTIDGYANDRRFSGQWATGRLELARYRFELRRTSLGFTATDEGDRSHVINFSPSGWQ